MTARRTARLVSWAAVLGAVAAGVAGCAGRADRAGGRIQGDDLSVYWAAPLSGASSSAASAALDGARMALAQIHGRIGRYSVALKVLDDATVKSGGWDPVQTTNDARIVAADPTAIGYLGDFNSGASAVSIPLLNRAGIAQISPASAAVGLTSAGAGASPGEPEKYYPLGTRTFARVVPSDAIQAVVQVRVARAMGCTRMFVLEDGEVDGEDGALSFALTAEGAGMHVVGVQDFARGASSYTSLATSVAQSGADCVLLSAIDERSSAQLAEAIVDSLPSATIVASAGLADSAFIDPADGGIPESVDPHVVVSSPALAPSAYPAAGRAFLASYGRTFGSAPPSAIFGYEAMSLMLDAISRATDHGHRTAERSNVVREVFATRGRRSVLGTYGIDRDGDITLRAYGVWTVARGHLSFSREQTG